MRFSCPYNALCIRTKRILGTRGGERGRGAERGTLTYVNLTRMQYVKFAARRRIRCVQTCIPLSLSVSLPCCVARSFPPSFPGRERGQSQSEKWNREILAEEEMEKYDNTIETASIMRTENGNGFGWWMERCLKRKKKKKKEKRWRFSEPISRLRFKQNVGRFFFEMEETLNKTFDLYIRSFPLFPPSF